MYSNDDYDEFEGWERYKSPGQLTDEELQAHYQSGFRAGYEEGERDGYNRAVAELQADKEEHIHGKDDGEKRQGKRATLTVPGNKGPASDVDTD